MRVVEPRFLTALAVIGMCALTAFRGVDIVRFKFAAGNLPAGANPTDALRPWVTISGVAFSAREAAFKSAATPSDAKRAMERRDGLAEILSVKPMSSAHWLSVSGMRLVAGESTEKVAGALLLSSLTGPNEGYVLSQRGIFALSLWEKLPTDVRRRAVTDLAAAILGGAISDQERNSAAKVLATKTGETRQEVAELLRAEGVLPNDLTRIGLKSE
jgi:hypothetical protein